MKILSDCARAIDWLNEKVGAGVSWLTSVLVLLVCVNVFLRYVLNYSQQGMKELEWHLFAVIILLGAAYTLKHDKHVRVDLLYMRLGKKGRAWVNLLGSLLFLIPFCAIVIWHSIDDVRFAIQDNESSPNPGGLPAWYVIKSVIPLGFGFLGLQAISVFLHSLLTVLGREPDPPLQEEQG